MLCPIIVNYDRHEATYRLREWAGDCVIVDNGSATPYPGATVRLPENRDTIGGVLAGIAAARERKADIYWLLSTSMEPIGENPRPAMEDCFIGDVVGVSPLWTGDIRSTAHLPMTKPGRTKLLNTFSAWRADWLESVGLFDPALTSGWGTDFEISHLAREKVLLVTDDVQVKIHETRDAARADRARGQMETVLSGKYGADWRKALGADGY